VHILEDRSLKLDDVTLEDMGEYSCEADNAVGSITATGILTVHGKLIDLTLYNTCIFLNLPSSFSTPEIHYPSQESAGGDWR